MAQRRGTGEADRGNRVLTRTAKLAIEGGTPVRSTPLPYGKQWIDESDIAAVVDVLRSDWLTTGPKVEEFETSFAAATEARYAVSFSSGTAALHGAVAVPGLQPGARPSPLRSLSVLRQTVCCT